MRFMTLALLPLLVHCGGSNVRVATATDQSAVKPAAVAPTPAAETITLNFAWPAGKHHIAHELAQVHDGAAAPGSFKTSMDVSVEPADGALQILASNVTMATPEGMPGLPPQFVEAMVGLVPNYRVSPAGEFVDVIDAQGRYDAAMAKLDIPDGAKKMMFGQYQGDAIVAATKREWRGLVGRWKGRTLQVGVPIAEQTEIDLPNGQRATAGVDFSIERVPCNAADTGTGCVLIAGASKIDGDAALKAMSAGPAVMGIKVEYKSVAIEQRFELVTEPSTLVPHKFVSSFGIKADQVVMGEAVKSDMVSTETRTYTYK